MIKALNNQDNHIAKRMNQVFQSSYSVEAKILQADDFPPLKRTLEQYQHTDTVFYGYWKKDKLAAVVEIRSQNSSETKTHIQSLVVSPNYFRQGIASQLMAFVLENFNTSALFVETGINNHPAIKLYEKFGFKQTNQWDTECGIRKVRLDYQN